MYLELLPSPALRPYIQLIWCVESDGSAGGELSQRIAPDGIVELVLYYRGRVSVRLAGREAGPQPRSSLVCQASRYLDLDDLGAVGFVSVRFRPWGALHFFEPPVSDLADRIVSAADVWGPAAGALEERLALARSVAERVALVEAFLFERLRRHHRSDVEEAVRAVWRRRGVFRVPDLCHDLGISERTAQRVFQAAVGMPPKRYGRLVRFLNACAVLRGPGASRLAEVAQICGYYDQAHFSADFKAFSGMTPAQFPGAEVFSFLEID